MQLSYIENHFFMRKINEMQLSYIKSFNFIPDNNSIPTQEGMNLFLTLFLRIFKYRDNVSLQNYDLKKCPADKSE